MATINKERCDIRIWSGDCKQDGALSEDEKYLCKPCGKLDDSVHEVRHDFYSYVSGDYHNLS
jgi:hypothetical protein